MPDEFNFWDRTILTELAEEGKALDMARNILKKDPGLIDLRSNIYQSTPLLAALSSGKATLEFVKLLIEYKAQIDASCYGGRTILHCSANAANLEHLHYIMSLPGCPDVNSKMENGNTPLHAVCMQGNGFATIESRINVINFLLEKGADCKSTNNDGFTAAHLAKLHGFNELAIQIEGTDHASIMNFSPNVNATNTPLDFWDRFRLVALAIEGDNLIEASNIMDVEPSAVNQAGYFQPTPLLLALSCGQASIDFIKLLVGRGAQLDATYYNGRTILHCAANAANQEHCAYIMTLPGCPDINSKMENGNTALHAVCMQGTTSATLKSRSIVARMLIDNGIDIHTTNNEGLTASDLARAQELTGIAELIDGYATKNNTLNKFGYFNHFFNAHRQSKPVEPVTHYFKQSLFGVNGKPVLTESTSSNQDSVLPDGANPKHEVS